MQERLKAAYGLDKPLWQQYTDFLGKAVRGDLGPSYTQRSRSVMDIIGETFPVSLQLAAVATAIATIVGIPLGVLGAVRHNRPLDYLSTFVSVFGVSTPSYVVTSLLVLLLASKLHLCADEWLGWRLESEDHRPGAIAGALPDGGPGALHQSESAGGAPHRLHAHGALERTLGTGRS